MLGIVACARDRKIWETEKGYESEVSLGFTMEFCLKKVRSGLKRWLCAGECWLAVLPEDLVWSSAHTKWLKPTLIPFSGDPVPLAGLPGYQAYMQPTPTCMK